MQSSQAGEVKLQSLSSTPNEKNEVQSKKASIKEESICLYFDFRRRVFQEKSIIGTMQFGEEQAQLIEVLVTKIEKTASIWCYVNLFYLIFFLNLIIMAVLVLVVKQVAIVSLFFMVLLCIIRTKFQQKLFKNVITEVRNIELDFRANNTLNFDLALVIQTIKLGAAKKKKNRMVLFIKNYLHVDNPHDYIYGHIIDTERPLIYEEYCSDNSGEVIEQSLIIKKITNCPIPKIVDSNEDNPPPREAISNSSILINQDGSRCSFPMKLDKEKFGNVCNSQDIIDDPVSKQFDIFKRFENRIIQNKVRLISDFSSHHLNDVKNKLAKKNLELDCSRLVFEKENFPSSLINDNHCPLHVQEGLDVSSKLDEDKSRSLKITFLPINKQFSLIKKVSKSFCTIRESKQGPAGDFFAALHKKALTETDLPTKKESNSSEVSKTIHQGIEEGTKI